MSAAPEQMPEALSSRRIGKRLLQIAAVVGAVALIVLVGPGLGTVRDRISHAASGCPVSAAHSRTGAWPPKAPVATTRPSGA